ncbi:MAG: TauD/TfdA family dioxygenase [Rhodospirillales bacterium]|nr:TauD/TfdA family dioxygenase [Rhodospirillales bacterium]
MNNTNLESAQRAVFDSEAIALCPEAAENLRGPFALGDDDAFKAWRDRKLANFPASTNELVVEMRNPATPSAAEAEAIRDRVRRAGMAVYAGPAQAEIEPSKDLVRGLGAYFGLTRLDQNPYADEDAITPLHVAAGNDRMEAGRKLYIPYTNRAINWHTDGYYNTPDRRIRGMILHCVRQAGGEGGVNTLFDPEMAYLLMRERDPDMVRAFAAMDAMIIPANDMDDGVARGDVGGPVFSLNRADGTLYMRYTARKRNIVWADSDATHKAVAFMEGLLSGEGDAAGYIFTHRMEPGHGLICNNVLHTRTAFEDAEETAGQRMMLRARYLDRVSGTA